MWCFPTSNSQGSLGAPAYFIQENAMINNWYSRVLYAVGTLALAAGMIFIAGCGNGCC
jgi:hypothetical protein